MKLRILLQRIEYTHNAGEYVKNKTKNPFRVVMMKWFIFWYQSRFIKVKIWIVVTNTAMDWITTQEYGGDVTMAPFCNSVGIRIVSMMNYQINIYTRR